VSRRQGRHGWGGIGRQRVELGQGGAQGGVVHRLGSGVLVDVVDLGNVCADGDGLGAFAHIAGDGSDGMCGRVFDGGRPRCVGASC
jgi:hypothetical protein